MLVIKNFRFYPKRMEVETITKSLNDEIESIYRKLISFLKEIKSLYASLFTNVPFLYKAAADLVALFSKNKNSINGVETVRLLNDLGSALLYYGNNKLKFCLFFRTKIYKKDSYLKVSNELYDYLSSITFINHFQNDYDRIVSSSSFRRLQDKAQVFSLESFDYVRTRLTHSNEVSAVSEQIVSKMMFEAILEDTNLRQMVFLKDICKCASLLHDIGNPPFGHYGEHVIRNYFGKIFSYEKREISNAVAKRIGTRKKLLNQIIKTKQLINDFLYFDGNAQAFRIAGNLQQYRNKNSLNLTASVLRSIIKYPCNSLSSLETGKFGYFYSEENIIDFLKKDADYNDGDLYLPALIMEISDDIAYNISDFEDSYKKGLITYEDVVNANVSKEPSKVKAFIKDFKKYYAINKKSFRNPFEVTMLSLVQSLKISLISEAAYCLSDIKKRAVYLDRTKKNYHVLDDVPSFSICKFLKTQLIKTKVYSSRLISESELEADTILSYLLDEFVKAVLYVDFEESKKTKNHKDEIVDIDKYKKIIQLISPHILKRYTDKAKTLTSPEEKLYFRIKIAVDYISGMTDSFAKKIYQKISGKI